MSKIFGYARISSRDQNAQQQIDELRRIVADERDIIIDKQTGKNFDRDGYQLLKTKILREGDTLVIKSLDRLGRNYDQIREEWKSLTDSGINIQVLDFPLLNTAEIDRDNLIMRFVQDTVLSVLSFAAENERTNIRRRQREGIEAAQRKGVKFGRHIVRPEGFDEAYRRWKAGEITATAAIEELGMKRTTFYKRVRELEGRR